MSEINVIYKADYGRNTHRVSASSPSWLEDINLFICGSDKQGLCSASSSVQPLLTLQDVIITRNKFLFKGRFYSPSVWGSHRSPRASTSSRAGRSLGAAGKQSSKKHQPAAGSG